LKKIRFNYSKLIGLIAEKGLTQTQFSPLIGRTQQFLSKKFKNGESFQSKDIVKICDVLGIAPEDAHIYFFAQQFAQSSTF